MSGPGTVFQPPTRARYRVIVFAVALAIIQYIDRVCISQAAPYISADLGLSAKQMGYVFSAFTLAYALFEIPTGWLGDQIGPRKVLVRVASWWSFFTAATGWTWNYGSLVVARFLFGAGEAGCFPNLTKAFSLWLPVGDRTRAQALMWMGARWGGACAPLLVVAVMAFVSWRAAFFVFALLGVVWAVIFWRWFRDDPREHKGVNASELALLNRKNLPAVILAGCLLAGGAALQQAGMIYTTAGNAGFITGLYVVLIPLFLALFWRALSKRDELRHAISVDSLRIDLGPGAKAKPGDRGTFAPNFRRVGPSLMSKSLDDRIGVALLIELVKSAPSNIDLLAAFTVQEELGLRGARVAAHYFQPDMAIAIDATPANDLPMQYEGENTTYNTKLGLGPAIYVANASTLDDPRLVRYMIDTAEKAKIPYQLRQPGGGGTNAGAIQRAAAGVPVVSVSVPHRYTHSAMSVSRRDDFKNALELLSKALSGMSPAVLRR